MSRFKRVLLGLAGYGVALLAFAFSLYLMIWNGYVEDAAMDGAVTWPWALLAFVVGVACFVATTWWFSRDDERLRR